MFFKKRYMTKDKQDDESATRKILDNGVKYAK